jgi:hypothetical protein
VARATEGVVATSSARPVASVQVVDEASRRVFVCPPMAGVVDDVELSLLDPADEDDRRLLIEAEHPELAEALQSDVPEIRFGGQVMSPRLHIAMHVIVANQLLADEPPEMWQTALRLTEAGYERHDVLHMLGSVVSGEVWQTLAKGSPHDIDRMRRELAALPDSWEGLREEIPAERSRNRAERRAKERQRRRRG